MTSKNYWKGCRLCGGNILVQKNGNNKERWHTCEYYVDLNAMAENYMKKHPHIEILDPVAMIIRLDSGEIIQRKNVNFNIQRPRNYCPYAGDVVNPNYDDNYDQEDYQVSYWVYL